MLDSSSSWMLTLLSGRRRKKSCIPHPGTPEACTECFSRGVQCHEQEASRRIGAPLQDSNKNLQRRVTELEDTLSKVASRFETTPIISGAENRAAQTLTQLRSDLLPPTPASSTSASSPESPFDSAPVLSLFDNAILSRRPESGVSHEETSKTSHYGTVEGRVGVPRLDNTRQTLISLFPSQQRLDLILDASRSWWGSWQTMFPGIFGPKPRSSIHEFFAECRSSGSVQRISKALLCIAIGLQETSVVLDAKSAQDYTEQYLNIIDDLVLSKDDLAGTIDGIECMVLQAKHDSNNGRVRRAWVTFRRAIAFAQLQGLHLRSKDRSREDSIRRESLWKSLYQSDRFLSLLLGLPYCVSEMQLSSTGDNDTVSHGADMGSNGAAFFLRLSNIAGHVIDRNHEASSNNALAVTVKIEGELIDLASTMTADWWALDSPLPEGISDQLYSRCLPRFWYHQIRTLLHLPFMLKATTDRRYEYNKIAALESARGMLGLYQFIRPAAGFASLICKVVDFQAFTAAKILVLNMLGLSQTSSKDDTKEADADRSLVSTTTEILQKSSLETGGGVATQAARALEIFGNDGSFQGASKIAVPYFGTVSFGPGRSFANGRRSNANQAAQQPFQMPTPSEDSLSYSPQDQWYVDDNFASMPSDFNFGPYLQQPQDLDTGESDFANMNIDIDQDWSWFWNNTEVL